MIDTSKEIAALEEHEPRATEDELAEAAQVVSDALRKLAMSKAVIFNVIVAMLNRVYTTSIDTLAVTIGGDGFNMLLINPHFVRKWGAQNTVFGLCHEAGHIIARHLNVDGDLWSDPLWITATEAHVNWWCCELLELPDVPLVDGKDTLVNPKTLYKKYAADLRKQELTPLAYIDWVKTDIGLYNALQRMSKPPTPPKQSTCSHAQAAKAGNGKPQPQQGGGKGQDGDDKQKSKSQPGASGQPDDADGDAQSGGSGDLPDWVKDGAAPPLDQSELDHLSGKAINHTMKEATVNGNKNARDELLKREQLAEGNEHAQRMWGNYGVGQLRGQTQVDRVTDYWLQWLSNVVGTLLEHGDKLIYLKKCWWDPRLAHRGMEPLKRVYLVVDASGSMFQKHLKVMGDLIGRTPGVEYILLSFDGSVWPYELGEPFKGGGGTSFQVVSDYIDAQDEEADVVIIVTDGGAPEITPTDPEKWIWLITPGGSNWPEKYEQTLDWQSYLLSEDEWGKPGY